ncbi:hypothetical protein M422DRAFT_248551 [Sphaerobolus stellatus SS14]|nr:hypothetical protein M422DRAFT_248551 [Sphaerobolus stellatus SS14]
MFKGPAGFALYVDAPNDIFTGWLFDGVENACGCNLSRLLRCRIDVLVVSAGPAGLSTAIALKQFGVEFATVDTAAVNRNGSRAAIVHTSTLERDEGTALCQQESGWYNQDHPTSILVSFEDGSSIRSRYIVGADGARSTVRKLAGIDFRDPFSGESYDEPPFLPSLNFVLADAFLQLPLPHGIALDRVTAFFDPFLFIVPLSGTIDGDKILCRIGLGSVGGHDKLPKLPTLEYLQRELNKRNPFNDKITALGIKTGSRYRTRSALAATYLKKMGNAHILLVGDAAHVHTPMGGQGMNLGICDGVATARAIRAHLDAKETDVEARDGILIHCAERRREIRYDIIGATQKFNYLVYWNRGWRRIFRNMVLVVLIRIPCVQKHLAMLISGLKNRG